jgi:hypothetical protein
LEALVGILAAISEDNTKEEELIASVLEDKVKICIFNFDIDIK